jgi:LmbE family N-acetylglucosaminyl deacetylase
MLLLIPSQAPAREVRTLPELAPPTAADRVLVVAPHPDDETLCCAGILQLALRAGAAVGVVWLTAGDSFEIDAMVAERTLRPKGLEL